MSIEIRQHTPGKDLKDFIRVPYEVFKNDPVWIAPLDMMIRDQLNPKKNPFFEHAEVALFTARKNGQLAGRISAQVDHEQLKYHQDSTGLFGFFDTIDDQEVASELIRVACDWVNQRGMKRIRGPISLSVNEELGLLVDGFNTPPAFLMSHSTPYQGKLAEVCGLEKAKDLFAWRFNVDQPGKRAIRAWEQTKELPEVHIRSIDRSNLDEEIRTVLDIFNDAWSENWGYVPTTEAEARKTAEDMKLVLETEMVFIIEIDGKPAAMCVCLPNLNEAIQDLGGKLLPLGLFKLLWRIKVKHPVSARVVMLGIKKEYRNKKRYGGLAMTLCTEIAKRGLRLGYRTAELSWTLEDNIPINLTIRAMGAEKYKTYRIYEKPL